jgi:hypothetical protein
MGMLHARVRWEISIKFLVGKVEESDDLGD